MIPSNAPFSPEQSASLSALISGFSPEQSSWLSGYLAGLGSSASTGPVNLTVAYGTESGNSEELAARTVKAAKGKGFLMVSATPLTRSSYHAGDDFAKMQKARQAAQG